MGAAGFLPSRKANMGRLMLQVSKLAQFETVLSCNTQCMFETNCSDFTYSDFTIHDGNYKKPYQAYPGIQKLISGFEIVVPRYLICWLWGRCAQSSPSATQSVRRLRALMISSNWHGMTWQIIGESSKFWWGFSWIFYCQVVCWQVRRALCKPEVGLPDRYSDMLVTSTAHQKRQLVVDCNWRTN